MALMNSTSIGKEGESIPILWQWLISFRFLSERWWLKVLHHMRQWKREPHCYCSHPEARGETPPYISIALHARN